MRTAMSEEEFIYLNKIPKTRLWLGDLGKALTALFLLASIPALQEHL